MFEYEYTGEALHTLPSSAPIMETAPSDLGLTATGAHGISAGAGAGAAHAAAAFGGKAFVTLAGTATLASGVAFGGNVVAPALGHVAQTVQAAAAAQLIPEGGSVTSDGAILDATGTVVGQAPTGALDPINLVASAFHSAVAAVAPDLAASLSPSPKATDAPLTLGAAEPTASPSGSASASAGASSTRDPAKEAGGTLLALPALDFGNTSTATTAASGNGGAGTGAHGAAGAAAGASAGNTSTATTAAGTQSGTGSSVGGKVSAGASAAAGHSAGSTTSATQAAGGSASTSSGSTQRASSESAKHAAEQQREQAQQAAEQQREHSGEHEGGDD